MKKKIVLDFDDTLVKSSEQIIRMLNAKYSLNKSIEDLKDWGYKSIAPKTNNQEIEEFFASKEFFENVQLNNGVREFIAEFHDNYKYIICSKGSEDNLKYKKETCDNLFSLFTKYYEGTFEYEFIGVPFTHEFGAELDKSSIDLSDCLFAIDDNYSALKSLNVPFKILLKNYKEFDWNQSEPNDNIYIINSFSELAEMCRFDIKLENEGEIIGKV